MLTQSLDFLVQSSSILFFLLCFFTSLSTWAQEPPSEQHPKHSHPSEKKKSHSSPKDSSHSSHPSSDLKKSHPSHGSSEMESMEMNGMFGSYPMTRESSGTSWQPQATPMDGLHWMKQDWTLMFHGFATGIYDRQGGKRGDDKFFSSNMFSFMAQRPLGPGTFGFRSMFSLEPATIGKRGYPLLLQTGETADGRTPLVDRQHPHDLLMELALSYSFRLSENSSLFAYFGMPGEPALGPPTFMHRFSGMEIPEAPITHHWLDSTHITYGVATLGYVWKNVKLDASIFTGREPDQNRWNFDKPRFDSYSVRLSYNPTPAWALQVSYGYLKSPEQLEPNVNVDRVTFSGSYHKAWKENDWQTTFAWGLNHKRSNDPPTSTSNAFLLESTLNLKKHHNILGRFENVSKDELFLESDPLHGRKFNVSKLSLGYLYDLSTWHHMRWGFGGLMGFHFFPESLHSTYGDFPVSFMLFARVRFE